MRVLSALAIAIAVSAGPAHGQQIYEPDSSPPARVILDAPVTVPFVEGDSLPIVEVRVNGRGPFRFGIETGANFVVITPAVASTLALERTGGPDDTPSYRLESIEIGGARFEGIPVGAMRFAQTTIDGVLGLPLYRGLLLTLDYPARQARFEHGTLPEPDGASVLPLAHAGPFWSVPVAVAGLPHQAIIDTRSTGGFGFTPQSAAAVPFEGELQVVGRARGAAIAETVVKSGRVKGDITLGRYTFPSPAVSVRELPPGFPVNPLMGNRVLQNFVVTLDQRSARVRFARSGPVLITLDAPAPPRGIGGAPEGPLAAYTGRYGVREISIADGQLTLQRDGGPPLRLVPAGQDAFTLAEVPEARIRFLRDAAGKVATLEVLNRDGKWESAARSK